VVENTESPVWDPRAEHFALPLPHRAHQHSRLRLQLWDSDAGGLLGAVGVEAEDDFLGVADISAAEVLRLVRADMAAGGGGRVEHTMELRERDERGGPREREGGGGARGGSDCGGPRTASPKVVASTASPSPSVRGRRSSWAAKAKGGGQITGTVTVTFALFESFQLTVCGAAGLNTQAAQGQTGKPSRRPVCCGFVDPLLHKVRAALPPATLAR
jgi:hypothetical protein